MYDNTCKFLAENFSSDFASWLLGEPIPLTKLEASELSVEPIRADSVIFLESSDVSVHIEFQTSTDENMAFRMLDYWVRLRRKFPIKQIHQTVIYLKRTTSRLAYQSNFESAQTTHKFNVVRLWEQPTEDFKQFLGLLPLAVLTNTDDPAQTLQEVAQQLESISNKILQSNVAAATYVIAGLALDKEIIQRLLRREIMKESVTYQEILLEGMAEGEARGKAKGLVEGEVKAANQIALNMLHSGISIDLIAQFTGLSVEQIQKLQ
jgi:predicted transposase/invertase (TIGR01784 family)